MLTELERVVPPATSRQVGEWVAGVAGEALRARGVELMGIEKQPLPASGPRSEYPGMRPRSERDVIRSDEEESDSRSLPIVRGPDKETLVPPRPKAESGGEVSDIVPRPPPLPKSAASEESLVEADLRSEPPPAAPPAEAAPPALPPRPLVEPTHAVAVAPSLPPALDPAVLPPLGPGRPLVLMAALGGIVLLGVIGLARLTFRSRADSHDLPVASASAPGAYSAMASASAITVTFTPPPPEGSSAALVASAVPGVRVADSSQARPAPPGSSQLPASTRPAAARPASQRTGVNCSPPFTVDAQGVRIPKRECFR
jgi:serine/threonine-protein kinase